MHLSYTIEHALCAMTQLAAGREGVFVNSQALAEKSGVPSHYILKVMHRLVEEGLVLAKKGHGGGFMLARRANAIRFADVLDAFGYETHGEHCPFGWPTCDEENPCPIYQPWTKMSGAFKEWAEETTLADLAPSVSLSPRRAKDSKGTAANVCPGPRSPRPPNT